MSKLKLFIIFASILLVLSVQSISAHELDDTQHGNDTIVTDSPDIPVNSIDTNVKVMNNTDSQNLKIEDTSSPGTFDDLQVEIDKANAGSVVDLFIDYNGDGSSKIVIDKDLTIDGHGHTINCFNNDGYSVFYSTNGTILLKNINILNGHNADTNAGSAIYITGTAQYTVENCTFENNWAQYYGGAIYNAAGKELSIKNCRFTSNKVEGNNGGAIYSNGNVNIENSIFENNKANVDGGAIFAEANVYLTNCTFENNRAEGTTFAQCYGGAIRARGDVNVNNSTFKDNYAADYGGAIYANNIHINSNQNMDSTNTFFINNRANDNDGGAIYADISVDAINAEFSKNSALVDGGAIYACDNVLVNNCLFESNQASGAKVSKCYGGAIRAEDNTHVINSTFRDNYAENRGGAIHSDTTTLEGENIFERNIARDHGGAIYTNIFTQDVLNVIFIDNEAQTGDGGAIYINSANRIGIKQCRFINNKCKNDGGAIYLDSSKSELWLTNNVFDNNTADDGQTVYTWGTYKELSGNFWAGNNPSPDNKQVTEWGFWSNKHYGDATPLKLDLILDWHMDGNDEIVFNARIAYFTINNELYNDIKMVDANYSVESNGKSIDTENDKMENNQIYFDFHPSMGTSVVTIQYGGYTLIKTITIEYESRPGMDFDPYKIRVHIE